jgi:carboxymethylenebutenolidase
VVVHEWHGLNEVMKLHCAQFAQAGFLPFAPDLFHGKVATTDEEAASMLGTFDFQKAVGEIGYAVAYLLTDPLVCLLHSTHSSFHLDRARLKSADGPTKS